MSSMNSMNFWYSFWISAQCFTVNILTLLWIVVSVSSTQFISANSRDSLWQSIQRVGQIQIQGNLSSRTCHMDQTMGTSYADVSISAHIKKRNTPIITDCIFLVISSCSVCFSSNTENLPSADVIFTSVKYNLWRVIIWRKLPYWHVTSTWYKWDCSMFRLFRMLLH